MAQSTASNPPFKVCVLAWDGMDLLDFTGPIEVLFHCKDSSSNHFAQITVASEDEKTISHPGVSINRDMSIKDVIPKLGDFDILIVPGGRDELAEAHSAVGAAVRAFSELPPRQEPKRYRGLVSICGGVYFLADQGLLKGRKATGYSGSLSRLQKLCDERGGTQIIQQAYVDCGTIAANGINIITSGSVATGIDCTLYVAEKVWGYETAGRARDIMSAVWRREAKPEGP